MGSLVWLARCTRPDIAYVVHWDTRRAHAPAVSDSQLSKRIASYLKGIKNVKFLLGHKQVQQNITVQLPSASDADFTGDNISRKLLTLDVPLASISVDIDYGSGTHVGFTCRSRAPRITRANCWGRDKRGITYVDRDRQSSSYPPDGKRGKLDASETHGYEA